MTDLSRATEIVRSVRKLDARMAALKSDRDALTAELLSMGWESGKVTTAAGSFTVSAVNTYPQSAMLAGLTVGQANLCWKPKALDPAKVKALYPVVYAAAKQSNGQKVTFG